MIDVGLMLTITAGILLAAGIKHFISVAASQLQGNNRASLSTKHSANGAANTTR